MRNDVGQFWENYVIAERLKYKEYHQVFGGNYFWRTYGQQEIDWVEERDGNLFGYELKYKDQKVKTPPQWEKSYPDAEFKVITKSNYREWVM